jgi:hypothetical protein
MVLEVEEGEDVSGLVGERAELGDEAEGLCFTLRKGEPPVIESKRAVLEIGETPLDLFLSGRRSV